jgi:hypothetical protein
MHTWQNVCPHGTHAAGSRSSGSRQIGQEDMTEEAQIYVEAGIKLTENFAYPSLSVEIKMNQLLLHLASFASEEREDIAEEAQIYVKSASN